MTPGAHIAPNDFGDHVSRIQQALQVLTTAALSSLEIGSASYGRTTAEAVKHYKCSHVPPLINLIYETTVDNIVGQMTIRAMDDDLRGVAPSPSPIPSAPIPVTPGPTPPVPSPIPPPPPKPSQSISYRLSPAIKFKGSPGPRAPLEGYFSSQVDTAHSPWQMLPAEQGDTRSIMLSSSVMGASSNARYELYDDSVATVTEVNPSPVSGSRVFKLQGKRESWTYLNFYDERNEEPVAKLRVAVLRRKSFTVAFFRGHFIKSPLIGDNTDFGTSRRGSDQASLILSTCNRVWGRQANVSFTQVGAPDVVDLENLFPNKDDTSETNATAEKILAILSKRVNADRYVLFIPDQITLPGDSKGVTLACTGPVIFLKDRVAPGSVVCSHELGHSIGLRHFGLESQANPRPNSPDEFARNSELIMNLMFEEADPALFQAQLTPFQIVKANRFPGDWRNAAFDNTTEHTLWDDQMWTV